MAHATEGVEQEREDADGGLVEPAKVEASVDLKGVVSGQDRDAWL